MTTFGFTVFTGFVGGGGVPFCVVEDAGAAAAAAAASAADGSAAGEAAAAAAAAVFLGFWCGLYFKCGDNSSIASDVMFSKGNSIVMVNALYLLNFSCSVLYVFSYS